MDIRVGAATNVGRVRDHNEDSFCVNRKHKIFIVADGMGGHAAGEIASNQLKDYIEEFLLKEEKDVSVHDRLTMGVQAANRAIYQMGIQDAKKRGMGTTATILTVAAGRYYIAQVGDSRCYRLRKGKFEQITRDHSRVFQLYESGLITKDEMEDHPLSNVITRSIGNHSTVDPDVYEGDIEFGDRFLLCSDGLSGEVRDSQVEAILDAHKDPQEAVDVLIETALENGGKDNVTAVILDFREGEDERRKTVPMTLDQLRGLPPPPGSVDRKREEAAPPASGPTASLATSSTPSTAPPMPAPPRVPDPPGEERKSEPPPRPPPEPAPRGGPVASGPGTNLPLVAGAAAAVALALWLLMAPASPRVEVLSWPGGAEVYVNGKFKGVTPEANGAALVLEDLEAGPSKIRVRKGEKEQTVDLDLKAGRTERAEVVLDTRSGG